VDQNKKTWSVSQVFLFSNGTRRVPVNTILYWSYLIAIVNFNLGKKQAYQKIANRYKEHIGSYNRQYDQQNIHNITFSRLIRKIMPVSSLNEKRLFPIFPSTDSATNSTFSGHIIQNCTFTT